MKPILRIGLLAPPLLPVPPPGYGGTERVVYALAEGLHARGHDVTLLASGDSQVSCRLVPTVARACWSDGGQDFAAGMWRVLEVARREAARFDLIHSHLDALGFELAWGSPAPLLTTMHGRLDEPPVQSALQAHLGLPLVAISRSQRDFAPWAGWLGVVMHGLDLHHMPFAACAGDYLLFVGRITREKGIVEAIRLAQRTNQRLLIAAKLRDAAELALFETEVKPALAAGRVDYLGEVESETRNRLFAGAQATLMLGDWPEPFGLVAIESLAAGTPVIGLRRGAIPEIVENGIDGFVVDQPTEADKAVRLVSLLDRRHIRRRALHRFSAARMVDEYLALYGRLLNRVDVAAPPDSRRAGQQTSRVARTSVHSHPRRP